MTLYDACQLRAAANSWRERIRRDNSIDPDARRLRTEGATWCSAGSPRT